MTLSNLSYLLVVGSLGLLNSELNVLLSSVFLILDFNGLVGELFAGGELDCVALPSMKLLGLSHAAAIGGQALG